MLKMNKEDYKQLYYLLADYRWEIACDLLNSNLSKEARKYFDKILESIDLLLKSAPINCDRYYDCVGVCADDK